jgi:hypothetical protein
MAKFPDLTGDGEVTQADILKGRGVKAAKKGGLMKNKMKRYNEGDVVELESRMGPNENIDDDVRARAMAAMAARETGAEEAEPAKPKAEPKPKPKAKAEPKKKTSSFEGRTSPFAGKTSVFKKMASGGSVSSASKRADGCAIKGKTRGKMV